MYQGSDRNSPSEQRFVRRQGYRESPYMPFVYFMAGCCCYCIVYLTLVFIYAIIRIAAEQNSSRGPIGQESHTWGYTHIDNRQGNMRNFDENQRACNADQRYLPFPTSQEEEEDIVKEIRSTVNESCKFVFFGYRAATDVRYQSLTGETWASLKKIPGGILPFDFKNCYEIKFIENGSFAVGNLDNCTKKTGKRLLFLTANGKENCLRNPFKCVEIYNSLPKDDVITSIKLARKNNSDLLGLVPFDKDHPPETLQLHTKLLATPAVVMAVKYKFMYKYGTVVQKYTSKRFAVVDPEHDCLGYDIKRDKIVTLDCHDTGCQVCSHRAT